MTSLCFRVRGRGRLPGRKHAYFDAKRLFAYTLNNGEPFPFAGLWDAWKDPDNGEWLQIFAIITTEARILERIGQQIRALKVPAGQQWGAVGTLMAFILGICRQNAANRHLARTQNLDRAHFLEAVSAVWSRLDDTEYPFARSVAGRMRSHDDRADFLAGIDLILAGITSLRPRPRPQLKRSTPSAKYTSR